MKEFQPMKAPSRSVTEDELTGLAYPVLASPKLDGLRAVGYGGGIRSRTLRPFRNSLLSKLFEGSQCGGLDGELVSGFPFGPDVLPRTSSVITAAEGGLDFMWHLFDDFSKPGLSFDARHKALALRLHALQKPLRDHCVVLEHVLCHDAVMVKQLEARWLELGYEGLMLRSILSPYKFGRATFKEGSIYKFKRFFDTEAEVVEYEEGERNLNEQTRKPDGSSQRSTKKAGKVGAGILGTIVGRDLETGRQVRVSPGVLTHEQRVDEWRMRELRVGRIFTYKSFASVDGTAPRFPTFKCWRAD